MKCRLLVAAVAILSGCVAAQPNLTRRGEELDLDLSLKQPGSSSRSPFTGTTFTSSYPVASEQFRKEFNDRREAQRRAAISRSQLALYEQMDDASREERKRKIKAGMKKKNHTEEAERGTSHLGKRSDDDNDEGLDLRLSLRQPGLSQREERLAMSRKASGMANKVRMENMPAEKKTQWKQLLSASARARWADKRKEKNEQGGSSSHDAKHLSKRSELDLNLSLKQPGSSSEKPSRRKSGEHGNRLRNANMSSEEKAAMGGKISAGLNSHYEGKRKLAEEEAERMLEAKSSKSHRYGKRGDPDTELSLRQPGTSSSKGTSKKKTNGWQATLTSEQKGQLGRSVSAGLFKYHEKKRKSLEEEATKALGASSKNTRYDKRGDPDTELSLRQPGTSSSSPPPSPSSAGQSGSLSRFENKSASERTRIGMKISSALNRHYEKKNKEAEEQAERQLTRNLSRQRYDKRSGEMDLELRLAPYLQPSTSETAAAMEWQSGQPPSGGPPLSQVKAKQPALPRGPHTSERRANIGKGVSASHQHKVNEGRATQRTAEWNSNISKGMRSMNERRRQEKLQQLKDDVGSLLRMRKRAAEADGVSTTLQLGQPTSSTPSWPSLSAVSSTQSIKPPKEFSASTRAKLSAARVGKKQPEQVRRNISKGKIAHHEAKRQEEKRQRLKDEAGSLLGLRKRSEDSEKESSSSTTAPKPKKTTQRGTPEWRKAVSAGMANMSEEKKAEWRRKIEETKYSGWNKTS